MTSAFPARSAMWRYKGTPFSAAPALHTARDTPKMALAPNLAEIGRNCSQTCYVFIKRLSKTRTMVLIMEGHSTCHALPVVTDKLSWNSINQPSSFHPHCNKAHLHLFSDPSISSISLSIFSCSTTLIFCREKQAKHCLTPNIAPQILTYPLHISLAGTKSCLKATSTNSWRD